MVADHQPNLQGGGTQIATSTDELALVAALRGGDEAAFMALVERYQRSLLRLARMYVSSTATAEDVVQETWLGVLRGIATFEPRASLKTWIFRILVNRAKTHAQREGRTVPFSSLFDAVTAPEEPAVDPDRFQPEGAEYAGWWSQAPRVWEAPEAALLAAETRHHLARAIAQLPPHQREVITLRDVEGLAAPDVCNVLDISEMNQRVLLHRARAKVRQALEQYFTRE